MRISTVPLTPVLWPALERLFGANGACAGCWCMFWRLEKGERFQDIQGATAKRRFKALVQAGRTEGILAFIGDEPVGWLALGRRTEFPKLDRAPSLACDDARDVWSVPCFFVHRLHRGKGVAAALLARAVEVLEKRGAHIVEGYPLKAQAEGKPIPAAFAYTGTVPLFTRQGFEIVAPRPKGKQRARKLLGPRSTRGPRRRSRATDATLAG